MKTKLMKDFFIWTFFVQFICYAQSDDMTLIPDSNLLLVNMTHQSKIKDKDLTLIFNYFFTKKCNNYFFEINQKDKSIVFSFINTRIGGFIEKDSAIEINKGPVKTILLMQSIEDKNKEVRGLNPEYYFLTTITLNCERVPINESVLKVTEENDMISVSLPWPGNIQERDSLYYIPKKKKRTGLALTLAGLGTASVAGGSVLIWKLLSGKDDNSEEPSLPERPVTPNQ